MLREQKDKSGDKSTAVVAERKHPLLAGDVYAFLLAFPYQPPSPLEVLMQNWNVFSLLLIWKLPEKISLSPAPMSFLSVILSLLCPASFIISAFQRASTEGEEKEDSWWTIGMTHLRTEWLSWDQGPSTKSWVWSWALHYLHTRHHHMWPWWPPILLSQAIFHRLPRIVWPSWLISSWSGPWSP